MRDQKHASSSQPSAPGSASPTPLLAPFAPHSLAAWEAEVQRLMPGISIDRRLTSPTYESITLRPLYTAADTRDLPAMHPLPGAFPYLRGTTAGGYRQRTWDIAQELPYPDAEEVNAALRHDLACGQTAVHLLLDRASRAGLDPDEADPSLVGVGGTSLASVMDIERAIAPADLTETALFIRTDTAAAPFAALLVAACRAGNRPLQRLRGGLVTDPLAELVSAGEFPLATARVYDELAGLTRWAQTAAPLLGTLAAVDTPYHEGGGSAVHEVAFTLAAAVAHLRELQARGLTVEEVAPHLRFSFTVGTRFFLAIAKLRAARTLWAHAVAACGGSPRAQKMVMHVRTSDRCQTTFDPHTNILRGTTQGLAAILGGCDSLHINPYDAPLGFPDKFSRRIARNTQLILLHECHLDRVIDAAGGSWHIESLTAELAAKAWSLFQQVEAAGGLLAALQAEWPQKLVTTTAEARRINLTRRHDVRVGATLFPNAAEAPIVPRSFDQADFAARRAGHFRQMRSSASDPERSQLQARLQHLSRATQPQESFERAVAAASLGATLGEIAKAWRRDDSARPRVFAIARRRDAAGFENLRRAVLAWRQRTGQGPQVFLANVGPLTEYLPRVDFVRTFFEVGGLGVAADSWYADADAALRAARSAGTPVVVITATDALYPQVVPVIAPGLKSTAPPPLVALAGQPGPHAQTYRAAGIDLFLHRQCDSLAILQDLVPRLGVVI